MTVTDYDECLAQQFHLQMTKPPLIGGILGAVAVAGAVAYGVHHWQVSRPSKVNLEKVARSIWAHSSRSDGGRIFVSPRGVVCLPLPQDTPPDSNSKARWGMSWHMDFLDQAAASPARQKHLARLDALVSADLLLRKSVSVATPSGPQVTHRYVLSDAGWAAMPYDLQREGACFVFARTQYLRTTEIEEVESRDPQAQESKVFRVTARVGVASAAELQPWTRDPKMMSLFPEIQQALDGRDFVVQVSRNQGEWVNHNEILEAKRHPERAAYMAQLPTQAEIDQAFEAMRKLPAPTREELIALLQKQHGHGRTDDGLGCVPLPGSEKLPVDQKMDSTPSIPYRVAISNNIDRKPYDLVSKRTQPYLNRLEQLGVLVKVPDGAPGTYLATDFYELAPTYVESLYRPFGDCLAVGPPLVEMVDLQVFEEDALGRPGTSFQYKLRLTYPDHPEWMNDPVLFSQWSELRGLLERGMACDGRFDFDREKREMGSGVGTCWPAFDSVTEVQ